MTNKKLTKISGRIYLTDAKRKYSRLGVFENKGDKEYICIERIVNENSSILTYLSKTKKNEHIANKLNPGDIVCVKGRYIDNYFVAEEIETLSISLKGKSSTFFDTSENIRTIIMQKGQMLKQLRSYFTDYGFLEISTPILLPHYEGGGADPFITISKEGKKYFLKETNELILRRLLAANLGKIYEIGRAFRNIGTNQNSLNEFTVVESAIPYVNLEEGINFSEGLLKKMIKSIDSESPLLTDWEKIPFEDLFERITEKKYFPTGSYRKDREDLERILKEINGPVYLVGLPNEISPINKKNGKIIKEAVLVLNNSVCCDVCEFDDDKESVKRRLTKQKERTGRINNSFLQFMDEGMVPGVGIAFGLERWMQYFSGENINKLKNLGGII